MNTIGCRHPGLNCERICMECRGDFDIVDAKTQRRVGDVSDAVAMSRLESEFGDLDHYDNEGNRIHDA